MFALPALLGATSLAGLLSALLGDGACDWLSWLALAAPLAVVAYHRSAAPGRGRRNRR